jgi:hypothetical protein
MENTQQVHVFKIGDEVRFGPPFPAKTQAPYIINSISGDQATLIFRDNPLAARQVVHVSFIIPFVDDGNDSKQPIGFDVSPED